MKTILVTGAAGFIGFHTILALLKRGDRVIGLDNFNSYYDPKLKRKRAEILNLQGIEIIDSDLNNKEILKSIFERFPLTDVLHLAAQAGVRYARQNPEAYIKSNIDGFLAILERLRHAPEIKLTYASSSSVYGINEKIPFSEEDRTDRPANLYAATKKANELMAYSYHHLYGIAMTGLRFFTVYGPWGRPDMSYFSFSEAILKGEAIHLFNQGKMARDFTYIDDVVRGTLAAIDYHEGYEVFNLGNRRPVELLHFVSLLEKELGREAVKVFAEPSPGEVETTFADISHAQEKLGFEPQVALEEGLHHFVKWFKEFNESRHLKLVTYVS